MARTKIYILLISCSNMEVTDRIGRGLAQSIPNAYYERQYFSPIFPVISVKRWFLTLYPNAKVMILGNINHDRFGTFNQLVQLKEAFMRQYPACIVTAALYVNLKADSSSEEEYERRMNSAIATEVDHAKKHLETLLKNFN